MKTLGETIATLRKKQGLTQEALASAIGASPQTISKWENNITSPDITLLPILADIFEISIDELFGRGDSTCLTEQVLSKSCQALLKIISASCYNLEFDENQTLAEYTKEYLDYLKTQENARTGVFRSHGSVYYREKFGGLLLKRPEEGWTSLLENERAVGILELLCDTAFRRVLIEIFKSRKTTFTLNAICQKCGIEDPEKLKEQLRRCQLFSAKSLEFDDTVISVYTLDASSGCLSIFFCILAAAAEYTEYVDHYFNCAECYATEFLA